VRGVQARSDPVRTREGLATGLGHAVDDGLIAVFFFVIGLEVRREVALGELTSLRSSGHAYPPSCGSSC
jgi:Na+/H+ antiporter NhaA